MPPGGGSYYPPAGDFSSGYRERYPSGSAGPLDWGGSGGGGGGRGSERGDYNDYRRNSEYDRRPPPPANS